MKIMPVSNPTPPKYPLIAAAVAAAALGGGMAALWSRTVWSDAQWEREQFRTAGAPPCLPCDEDESAQPAEDVLSSSPSSPEQQIRPIVEPEA